MSINPTRPIQSSDIDVFRRRLFANITDLQQNKHRIRPDDYHQLLNYHQYALTIFDNIKIINQAEFSDPFNRNMYNVIGDNQLSNIENISPYGNNMKVIYQKDGRVISDDLKNHKFKGEWEQQFDSDIMAKPCYIYPPLNYWGLPLNKNT